ncbi:MAG: S-layer family protein [Stigonema ocellatum SAG 48.90 = DSM 106950]|nr:S-layer family protein [Stigonema ocellatum SAG 48.90 = DSM 106950]
MMKATPVRLGLVNGMLTGVMLLWSGTVNAQVTPDGTLHTTVSQSGNNFMITNGSAAGSNLFHSFRQFSVPTGGSVTFNLVNTPNISTIFSRVTGGSVSNIDGLIQTINSNNPVNLFVLNPSGIMFGPNAQLNIGGSFVGTTANSINFADGTQFSATSPSPLLTISVPIGLQVGATAGSIEVQGTSNDGIFPTEHLGIVASPGKTIALVGGDVNLSGGVITAPSGRIEVGAVGNGTVSLKPSAAGWQLGYEQAQDLRSISLNAGSSLWNPYPVGNPAGGIQVVGRDIRLDQSQIAASVLGKGQGGNIDLNAQRSLWLGGVNANAKAPSSSIVNLVASGAQGNGGSVSVQAPQLTLQDGAAIETLSLGSGAAGDVRVTADTIVAQGDVALNSPLAPTGSSSSRISSENYASGAGGDIDVVARQITLDGSGQISTFVFPGASGRGGNITVDAADTISATGISPISLIPSGIGAYTVGVGNGGNVNVSTGTLNLSDTGAILTLVSRIASVANTGIGSGGDVNVLARESIKMANVSPISPTIASFLGSVTTGSGNAGNVFVTTPSLSLQAGATLNSITISAIGTFGDPKLSNDLGNGGNVTLNVAKQIEVSGANPFSHFNTSLGTTTFGNGNAGIILIQTNQLVVRDGATISTITESTGNAGALSVTAKDILLEGHDDRGSSIASSAPLFYEITRKFYGLPDFPTGDTGRISISTNSLTLRNGGQVTVTHEGTGNAGQLDIQANTLSMDGGVISATTASGVGGNINLQVRDLLVARHGSEITATAGGSGNGGNINIDGSFIVAQENSDIIANAFRGNGGNIQIATQGLFGIEARPQLTPSSDITASSQLGVSGNVQISKPTVVPNSGLVSLPVNLSDPSQQIASECAANQGSRFVATGRGGVPQNPTQQIGSDRTWNDVRDLSGYRKPGKAIAQTPPSSEVLIEATTWHRNAKGKVELIAAHPNAHVQQPLTCSTVPRSY